MCIVALRHRMAARARHERLRLFQEQVIQIVAHLPPHLEAVAEAARGDEADLRALALDDDIGDERGAVHDLADIADARAGHLATPEQLVATFARHRPA